MPLGGRPAFLDRSHKVGQWTGHWHWQMISNVLSSTFLKGAVLHNLCKKLEPWLKVSNTDLMRGMLLAMKAKVLQMSSIVCESTCSRKDLVSPFFTQTPNLDVSFCCSSFCRESLCLLETVGGEDSLCFWLLGLLSSVSLLLLLSLRVFVVDADNNAGCSAGGFNKCSMLLAISSRSVLSANKERSASPNISSMVSG